MVVRNSSEERIHAIHLLGKNQPSHLMSKSQFGEGEGLTGAAEQGFADPVSPSDDEDDLFPPLILPFLKDLCPVLRGLLLPSFVEYDVITHFGKSLGEKLALAIDGHLGVHALADGEIPYLFNGKMNKGAQALLIRLAELTNGGIFKSSNNEEFDLQ